MAVWDIISSGFMLVFFLGAVFAAIKVRNALASSTSSTRSSLSQKGVTYQNGRIAIQTDKAPPSREEYIASTQRAFERGAKQMSLHPEAFKMGNRSREPSSGLEDAAPSSAADSMTSGKSTATPEKRGFIRSKKLA